MSEVPHLVIRLGHGAFGVGIGTYGGEKGIAMIPAQDSRLHKVGEIMVEGVLTEMLPGTILVSFKDDEALDRHIARLQELRAFKVDG